LRGLGIFVFYFLVVSTFGQTTNEQMLLDLEKQRSAAIASHNEIFLEELYDDEFRGVAATGAVVNKQQLLEVFKLNNPEVVFSTDEMKATVYDGTAVVTGKLISKNQEGRTLGQSRFIHIYVLRDQQWKLIAGQATQVK
jgi:hypothetical protein